jgi:hypothetical protein
MLFIKKKKRKILISLKYIDFLQIFNPVEFAQLLYTPLPSLPRSQSYIQSLELAHTLPS